MLNIPQSQNCAHCEKDLKDNKDNSLHLGREYARIFVLGHYLFLVVRFSDKYPSIFPWQMEAIVYIYGLKVLNITDCLILILKVVRLIVTIISISITFYYYYYYYDIFIFKILVYERGLCEDL